MAKKVFRKILVVFKALMGGVFWYPKDLVKYRQLMKMAGQKEIIELFPQIFDRNPASHTFDKHYVYMDRWAFKYLQKKKPEKHVDVGSSIRFLSMASTVTNLEFVDIRPIKTNFDNFECVLGSILNMPFVDNGVKSLSCLHVAEHIGLGRYGDPLDVEGTKKACMELKRVLAPGGTLYFALPIGKQAVYFNAHRVHNPLKILEYFEGLELEEFSAVDDKGYFHENTNMENYVNSIYACGMFKFEKKEYA